MPSQSLGLGGALEDMPGSETARHRHLSHHTQPRQRLEGDISHTENMLSLGWALWLKHANRTKYMQTVQVYRLQPSASRAQTLSLALVQEIVRVLVNKRLVLLKISVSL